MVSPTMKAHEVDSVPAVISASPKISPKDLLIQKVKDECAAFKEPWYFPIIVIGAAIFTVTLIAGVVMRNKALVTSSISLLIIFAAPIIDRQQTLDEIQKNKIFQLESNPLLSDLTAQCDKYAHEIESHGDFSTLSIEDMEGLHKHLVEDIKKDILEKRKTLQEYNENGESRRMLSILSRFDDLERYLNNVSDLKSKNEKVRKIMYKSKLSHFLRVLKEVKDSITSARLALSEHIGLLILRIEE